MVNVDSFEIFAQMIFKFIPFTNAATFIEPGSQ